MWNTQVEYFWDYIYIYYVYTMLFLKINFQGYIQSLSSLNKKNVCFWISSRYLLTDKKEELWI